MAPAQRCAPWPGAALAAADAVQHLHGRLGLDLWMLTHVARDTQTVIASAGPWSELAPPGTTFPWSASLCRRMVAEQGPPVAPDVLAVPAYAEAAVGLLVDVRAYVGVPLVGPDEQLVGTLCAVSATRQPDELVDALEPVRLIGRMLSTVLAGEASARERSAEAAAAFALAEHDLLTGLRNRRGWESALAGEHLRCQRYGGAASVLVVDLDELKDINDRAGHAAGDDLLTRCAALLADESRPADVVARLGGDEFAVLAVECDALCVRALQTRLRVRLRSAGISASVGSATRRSGEDLELTWQRSDQAMYRDKRRRKCSTAADRVEPAGGAEHVPPLRIAARREHITLPPQPESVPAARHFLKMQLQQWGLQAVTDAVELAVSEVVTNAVLHARTPFEVAVLVEDDLEVTVRDTAGAFPVRRWPEQEDPRPDWDSEGGRGLALVKAVTDDCGVCTDDRGSTVWFRVDLPSA